MKDTAAQYPPRVKLVTEKWGILQSLRAAQHNLLEIIPEIALRQPIVTGKMGKPWHMVMDPDAIRRILRDRLEDYPKSDVTKNILRPAIGDSLFVAEGAHWRWQRRAAAPVFSHRNVANLAPIMTAAAERCCARIDAQVVRAADMYSEMVTSTFEVISDVTFSDDEGFDRDAIHKAINGYIDSTAKVSLFDVLGLPTWIPRPGRILSSGGTKAMKSMADGVINNRKEKTEGEVMDLLDLLMAGEDP
mgnify:CR=1 FL=1